MKATVIVLLISVSVVLTLNANPFKCKLRPRSRPAAEVEPITQQLIYKGFARIGQIHYGFIQLGQNEIAVVAGERVGEFRIKQISEQQLIYSVGGTIKHTPIKIE